MSDLIDRQAAIKDAESWVGMNWYEQHLIRNVIEWLKEFPPAEHGTNLASLGTDCISRQAAIDIAPKLIITLDGYEMHNQAVTNYCAEITQLPSAQPERRCVNCGRTVNNGGWYEDGRTRCPIEEHYALPKDGYCHLWEKRNITDDDYPERRTDDCKDNV